MAMEPTNAKRRLSAILMADVVGYSRLMGEDEQATLRTLTAHREVFAKYIAQHDGRVVNAPGDSILAEFGSVVDAVAAAAEIQRELAEKNAELPTSHAMHFRIGINLGDVLVKDDALYGDGVNIAARLEGLAEPGGIVISGIAYEQVKGKLPFSYEFQGRKDVKNIAEPVPAFKVYSQPGAAAHRVVRASRLAARLGERKGKIIGFAAAAAIVAAFLAVGIYFIQPPDDEPIVTSRGLPTIAVLPFENLSADPEQEYFVDGITEELITLLAQFRDLSVIARNSMFTYKGKAVDVRTVGEEMGADYVLEGSVRRSADQLRITAQLLSTRDGKHLWAETFDRKLTAKDLFALQDELSERVATAIAGAHGVISMSRFRDTVRTPPDHLSSYECVLRTHEYLRLQSPDTHLVARECLERVTTVDPTYVDAWAWLAMLYTDEYSLEFNLRPLPLERADEAIRKAINLDPSNPVATMNDAYYLYHKKDPRFFDRAREAVAANPRDAFTLGFLGRHVTWAGGWEEGLAMVKRAIELSPVHPGWYYFPLSHRAFLDGDYRRGLALIQKADIPGFYWYHMHLAINYARLGRLEKAREQAALIRQANPDFEHAAYAEFRKWIWEEDVIADSIAALREAGLDIPDEE